MASQIAQWLTPYELFVRVGLGAAVIVALAAIAGQLVCSASMKAAVWRLATVSMFLLVALELSGLGQAVAQLGRQWIANRAENGAAEAVPERLYASSPANLVESDSLSDALVVPPQSQVIEPEPVPQPSQPSYVNWLAALWISGTIATLCWIVAGRIAASRFRRRCMVMNDGELYERVASLRATFSLRRPVVLLCSLRTASPVVFAGWRPALVLPVNFNEAFDRQQQDAILAHELAHLAAHDAPWQSAALVLCSLLWWHPLVWWSRRQLRAAHEAVADEGSLVMPDGPRVLAEALVALGQRLAAPQFAGPQPRFGLSLGGGLFSSAQFHSGLGRRVQRLLNLPSRPWRGPRRTRMAFVHFSLPALVALAAAITCNAWAPSQVSIPQGETTMSILTTSWRGSLMATAFCAMLGNSPAPAAADDDPTPPPTTTDREAFQAKFQAIRARAAALDEQGKHDEADRLRREAKQMMSKIHGGSDDPRYRDTTPANSDRDKTIGRLKEMMAKANQLERDGKTDEADNLRREAKEIYAKSMPHTPPPTTAKVTNQELLKLRDYYMAMQEKIDAAKRHGNEEQIRALAQEMEALQARRRAIEADEKGNHYSTGSGDSNARLKHLRAAAENLKAAGCDAEAKHVMDLIGHIEAEARGKNYLSAYDVGAAKSGQAVVFGGGGNAAAMQELRSQIEQMRQEMQEMRAELKRSRSVEGR
jgi:beta-lactamase regulating signal transducer with metallopeptidase domain